jgi:hypothetical protein
LQGCMKKKRTTTLQGRLCTCILYRLHFLTLEQLIVVHIYMYHLNLIRFRPKNTERGSGRMGQRSRHPNERSTTRYDLN